MAIFGKNNDSRLPHSMRLAVFFLRLAIGLNFAYLGWSELFSRSLVETLRGRSIGGLYTWLASTIPFAGVPSAVFAWIFLVVGILIILGLFTRLSAIVGAVLVLVSWLPGVSFASWNPAQYVNDELIVFFGLIILVLAHAGTYIGLDKFVKWSRKHGE